MELRHLRYFVAVAEAGSVVGASKRLNLAQPALSTQIHDLERELGVALFERLPRGVRLTKAGEEFLGHARAMLASAAVAVEEIRRHATESAIVRVYPVDFPPLVAPLRATIAQFRVQFPRTVLQLVPVPYLEQAQALRDKRLDVGFSFGLINVGEELHAEAMRSFVTRGVMLARDHPLSSATSLPLADLAHYPFHSLGGHVPPDFRATPGWRNLVQGVREPGELRSAVTLGDGWLFSEESNASDGHAPLVYRPLADGITRGWVLYALRRRQPADSPSTTFIRMLAEAHEVIARASADTPSRAQEGAIANARAARRGRPADDTPRAD